MLTYPREIKTVRKRSLLELAIVILELWSRLSQLVAAHVAIYAIKNHKRESKTETKTRSLILITLETARKFFGVIKMSIWKQL